MSRPRALDLFCGAGGAAMGPYRAGFDVVGVDIAPQKHYPFPFIRGDALKPPVRLADFDLVWASPPCQAYSSLTKLRTKRRPHVKRHPDLVASVRRMLAASARHWVIENVVGAPLLAPSKLCGFSFGLRTCRHRLFESSFAVFVPQRQCQRGQSMAVYGEHPQRDLPGGGRRASTVEQGRDVLGIGWMDWRALTQAIPPAYSEHIGHYALLALGRDADAMARKA